MPALFLRDDIRRAWEGADAFAQAKNLDGTVYRSVERRRTLRCQIGDGTYFAKVHHGVGWLEIVKNLVSLRLPVVGARNEYAACRHLAERGVPAPGVAAYGSRGWSPAQRFSFVVLDALEPRTSLESVVDSWLENPPDGVTLRRATTAVARFARAMHDAGVVHRDFYVCHLLADDRALALDRFDLAVIDLHRARIFRALPARWRRRDLAALLFSTLDLNLSRFTWLRFVRIYCGVPLREVFAEDPEFWRGVMDRAQRLYRKGMRKQLVKGRYRA